MGVQEVAQGLALLGGGSLLPWIVKECWQLLRGSADRADKREHSEVERLTTRVGDLEELIDLLRKALDKHLIRESAVEGFAELLIALIEQALAHFSANDLEPPPGLLRNLDRARELLDRARAQIRTINEAEVR
jgi:hypothetical protein